MGVSNDAILEAVRKGGGRYNSAYNTWRFKGTNATVVLNEEGKLVTAWANNRAGQRGTPSFPRPNGPRGSGAGIGFAVTLVLGADALAQGLNVVIPYRKRLDAHLRAIDEDHGEADTWEQHVHERRFLSQHN